MDGAQVLAALNNTWSSMLDKYYDHIVDEYIVHLSKEIGQPVDELKKKAQELKSTILAGATNISETSSNIKKSKPSISSMKAQAKAAIQASQPKTAYSNKTRKELIELCKSHNLPVKRKNQDMIDSLVEYDKKNAPITSSQNTDQTTVEQVEVEQENYDEEHCNDDVQNLTLTKEELSDSDCE